MLPASAGPGAVPLIRYGVYDDADSIVKGSVLVFDTSTGEVNLAGTNPSLVAGIALQDKDTAPGYQAANNPNPITGREQKISYAVADRNTTFWATLTNGSSTRITPAQTDVGSQYGITAYSGVWTVDKAKTTTDARVQIVAIDLERGGVFFKWLTDHIAGDT